MINGLAFFDTKVLVYADDTSAAGKQDRAIRLLSEHLRGGSAVLSTKVLRLTGLSFWDALIVHAARRAGAAVLFSECLQPGAVLAGVRVVNPFAGDAG